MNRLWVLGFVASAGCAGAAASRSSTDVAGTATQAGPEVAGASRGAGAATGGAASGGAATGGAATGGAATGGAGAASSTGGMGVAPLALTAEAKAALDAWAAKELSELPSAVIGLVDASGLRWHRGVGARDAKGGPPPDRSTVYRIGSITKLLTGTALLQLRAAGRLSFDEPITRWVPEAPELAGVTLRHLVTHTSGIPSLGDGSAVYWEQRPPSEADLVRAVRGPVEFAPGAKTAYSNAGMALAGLVAARAAGVPLRAYLARNVFGPLGMKTVAWERGAVPADRLAIGVNAKRAVDAPHWQLGAFEAAGGLYASLDDMVGLARLGLGAAPEVLAPAALAEALRDDALPGPHGVAWIVGGEGADRFAAHSGSTEDYTASLFVLPGRGVAAIVLTSGPDTATAECAANALVTAAATGAPPASCKQAVSPELAERVGGALTQLRQMIAAPTPEAISALFDPGFLAHVPAEQVKALADTLRGKLGACTGHTIAGRTSIGGARGVRAELSCAKGPLRVDLAVAKAAPHRILAIVFPGL